MKHGEMLIAVMNNQEDFAIARDKHWYRIPVRSVNRMLKRRWPPKWLAFYFTRVFADEAYSIRYYAEVLKIYQAQRWQLFPEKPIDEKSNKFYFQILIDPLKAMSRPILSRRWRRIVFIPTTWEKFSQAYEINDLFDGSSIEDRLWTELKRRQIPAERQEYVRHNDKNYCLDFAVYCANGKIDIETDGDKWHHNPQIAAKDNIRNNDLVTSGWHVLRFSQNQVNDQMAEYCIPQIAEKINNLGGVEIEHNTYKKIDI